MSSMGRVVNGSEAFRKAVILSKTYTDGKLSPDEFRLHYIYCLINFSTRELWCLAADTQGNGVDDEP